MPNTPNAHSIIVTVPPLNTRERNIDRATIGLATRFSMNRNPASDTAERAKVPRMSW